MHRDEPEPVARRRVPLGEGVQQDDVARDDRGDAVEVLDERRVGGVVDDEQVGPVGLDDPAQLVQPLRPHRPAVGVAGVDEEEDLDPRVAQDLERALVEPVRLVGHGLDLHDVEPDPLEDRDLEVRRVGRGGDRDGVTRADDPVHLERREDVGHRRRAALGGEHVEPVVVVERRTREPHDVALGHLLEVRLHPVRRRVPEPEHGPDQLVHPLVGVEPELARPRTPRRCGGRRCPCRCARPRRGWRGGARGSRRPEASRPRRRWCCMCPPPAWRTGRGGRTPLAVR